MKGLAIFFVVCCCAFAQWTNVTALPAGKAIVVEKKGGGSIRGEFLRATDDTIIVRAKQQEVSVARVDVVRVEAKRNGHAKWWGLAIGAGSGAAVGAPVGTRIANESAGDLNVKGLSVAILAGAGALIGLAVGANLDLRHSTIYKP